MTNETDVNTFMASVNWQVNTKFSMNFGLAYSLAEMEMQDVKLGSVSFVEGVTFPDLGATTTWGGEYDPANTNDIESYSDLEYDVININIGATYAITDTIGLTVDYVYEDVSSDEDYVYGDEDGDYQSLMTYLTVRF
ncbi:MAG: MtrB/PioB family outer membrane beta-barrel protein [Thermodesulfobacteriota bacterium]|nr:MtrB/PioB family outer membrane beta-barrel protein [Thermodesulfobacteriota bacterium]